MAIDIAPLPGLQPEDLDGIDLGLGTGGALPGFGPDVGLELSDADIERILGPSEPPDLGEFEPVQVEPPAFAPAPAPIIAPEDQEAAPEPDLGEFVPVEIDKTERLASTGTALQDVASRIESGNARMRALQERFANAADDVERETIRGEAAALGAEQDALMRSQGELRRQADVLGAEVGAETDAKVADIQARAAEQANAEIDDLTARYRARQDERRAEEQAARLRVDDARARVIREADVQGTADGQGVIELIAEATLSGIGMRDPRFGEIIDRMMARTRTRRAERVDTELRSLGFAEDDVQAVGLKQSMLDAERQAEEAAILAAAQNKLEVELRQATDPLRQAMLKQQIDMVAREFESRDAQAQQAQVDLAAKQRRADVDLRKAEADARKAEAEAVRAERRARGGTGTGKPGAGLIAPNVVTIPGTDEPLVKFADNPAGTKEAATVRAIVGAQAKALDRVNEAIAMYDDAERQGLLGSAGWERSGQFESLNATLAFLRTDMALVKSGGLATTEGDDKWAGGLVPSSPKAWTSKARAQAALNALRDTIESEARNQLGSKTRLDSATRERVVASSRPRSVSRRQLERAEQSEASKDLVSPDASSQRRVTAVGQVETNNRKQYGDDYLGPTVAELGDALLTPSVQGDDATVKASKQALRRYSGAAKERREQEERGLEVISRLGEDHPGVVAARARIANLRQVEERAQAALGTAEYLELPPETRARIGAGIRSVVGAAGSLVLPEPAPEPAPAPQKRKK